MNIDRVQLFIAAARHLSITRAGLEYKISQPAVTRQLKILQEDDLGKILFSRIKGRGIKLTEFGTAFYRDAMAALSNVEQLEKKYGRGNSDSVTIAASYRPSKYLLPALMTEFSKKHPTANMTLCTHSSIEIEKLLLDFKVDLAITTNPTPNVSTSSFVTESYWSEPLTAFVAANHPLAQIKTLRPHDTQSVPVIIKARRQGESRTEALLSKFEKDGLRFKTVVRCDSPEVVKEFVRYGAGVGFLYYNSIKRGIERGYFKIIQIPGLDLFGQNNIIYSKERPLSALAKEFLEFLRASVAEAKPLTLVTRQISKGPQNGQPHANSLVQKILS